MKNDLSSILFKFDGKQISVIDVFSNEQIPIDSNSEFSEKSIVFKFVQNENA